MLISDSMKYFFFLKLSKYKVEDRTGVIVSLPDDALFSTKDLSIDSLILLGGMLFTTTIIEI